MGTYKVIQDIEAEDHLVGPLSFRQFVYALIGVFFYYLCFVVITKHLAFALVLFLPPALFCTFFAFPFGTDQPTEVWALAKVRFFFKPRKRIWDQSGVKELVTVTVPKKIVVERTNGLSQNEVKSRLNALADTLDTRGWAIKNVSTSTYTQSRLANQSSSERLLDFTTMPQAVPDYIDDPNADILDNSASPIAQHFGTMIQDSTARHRQKILDTMAQAKQDATKHMQWFAPSGQAIAPNARQVFTTELSAGLAQQAESHVQPIMPVPGGALPQPTAPISLYGQSSTDQSGQSHQPQAQSAMPAAPDPAILNLANRDDLSVSTLAREAQRVKSLETDGEVVVSLH